LTLEGNFLRFGFGQKNFRTPKKQLLIIYLLHHLFEPVKAITYHRFAGEKFKLKPLQAPLVPTALMVVLFFSTTAYTGFPYHTAPGISASRDLLPLLKPPKQQIFVNTQFLLSAKL
jgi:hypothetical protein